jgi:hypothetical protein
MSLTTLNDCEFQLGKKAFLGFGNCMPFYTHHACLQVAAKEVPLNQALDNHWPLAKHLFAFGQWMTSGV